MIENCRCDVLIQQPVVFQMKDEIGFCGAPNAFYGGGVAGRARTGGRRSGARGGHTDNRRAVARRDHIANRLHNPRGNDARSVGGADAGGRTSE